jgi:hypothetical protein
MIIINHEWNGAIPNFSTIDKISTLSILYLYLYSLSIEVVMNRIEAKLCTKKYFIVFSNGAISLDDIIGRNLNIFTSNETHIIRLELLLKDKINLTKIKR